MYPTKKISEILTKDDFSIGKIKTQDYLSEGNFAIVDQGKNLIGGYSNEKNLVYTGKLPVIVYGDHTNVVKYIDFPFIGGADGIKVFSFQKNIDTKYAFYLLEHFKPETHGYRRHYSLLKDIDLPLPPLPTQQKIVTKLDEAFANIDRQIALIKSNIENLSNLGKSFMTDIFHAPDVVKYNKKMGEFVEFTGGSQPPKEKFIYHEKEGYVRLIQIRDYKSDKHMVYVPKKLVTKFCTKEDVMVGRYGPPIFQILRGIEGAYNVALMKTKFDRKIILHNYLFWFLNNPNIQEYIISLSQRAAGQTGVNKTALECYLMPIPPIQAQQEIVECLDQIFEKNKILITNYESQISDLEKLKQSLLHDAFEGKLITE